jgi:hypothetical protein
MEVRNKIWRFLLSVNIFLTIRQKTNSGKKMKNLTLAEYKKYVHWTRNGIHYNKQVKKFIDFNSVYVGQSKKNTCKLRIT